MKLTRRHRLSGCRVVGPPHLLQSRKDWRWPSALFSAVLPENWISPNNNFNRENKKMMMPLDVR